MFLIENVPGLLDNFRKRQYCICKSLPNEQQQNRSQDLVELIELQLDLVHNQHNEVANILNLVSTNVDNIKLNNTKPDTVDNSNTEVSNLSTFLACSFNQENIALNLIGAIE
ncbi:hypothetical protein RHORCCE3_1743 [Rickettsia hoogstraalii str. RCCE3]|nr:hypothetical protein RHORCCE3_2445 [Rickettsia hoogstraalii str. RCCE3]KJV79964.1 hypothetical protein RHORCCE3_1743 [Rickettsia hoogstraalii str. RCCE3]